MNTTIGSEVIKELLKHDCANVVKKNKQLYDQVTGFHDKPIILFGASFIGKRVLVKLRSLGIEPIAFADNNAALVGQKVDGLQVISTLSAAQEYGSTAVFVINIYNHQGVQKQLRELHCSYVVPYTYLYWKYSEICLPCYCFDLPNKIFQESEAVLKAFDLLADDKSRREYIAQLKWRILMNEEELPAPQNLKEIYFPPDLIKLRDDELFVDAGAFIGDTIESIFEQKGDQFSGKIFSMEPDPKNRSLLQHYIDTLPKEKKERITVCPVAIGDRRGKIRFNAAGDSASAADINGSIEVESLPLDELLVNVKPTFIKMDIEGLEPEALMGCREIIKKHHPVLAICIYHAQEHLWSIPLLINELSDSYDLFIRRYLGEFWDIVCYAIPKDRLLAKE